MLVSANMKRFIVVAVLISIVMSCMPAWANIPSFNVVYASTPPLGGHELLDTNHDNWNESVPSEPLKTGAAALDAKEIQDKYQGLTPLERMLANLFGSLTQTLYELLGIKDPLELIFDYDPVISFQGDTHHKKRDELYLGLFDPYGMDLIGGMFNYLIRYTPILFTIMVSVTGLYLLLFATTSDTRVELKDIIQGIVAGVAALALGPHLMELIFDVIYIGVDVIKNFVEQRLIERGLGTPRSLIGVLIGGLLLQKGELSSPDEVDAVIGMVSSLGYILIIFIIFIGAGILNWQYFIRKLTIALAIIIFPVVAMVSVLPTKRRALQIWFGEFIASASLVLVHAFVYGFLILMFTAYGQPFGLFETMVYVLGMSSATAYIRKLFGAETGGWTSNATGIAGLGGLIGLLELRRRMPFVGIKDGISDRARTGKTGSKLIDTEGGKSLSQSSLLSDVRFGTSREDVQGIIGHGRDITQSQASLMAGQTGPLPEISSPASYDTDNYMPFAPALTMTMSASTEAENGPQLNEQQQLELQGPQKGMAIQPPETSKAEFWSKVGRTAGRVGWGAAVATGAIAGGLMAAAGTGSSTIGYGLGAVAGHSAAAIAGRIGATGLNVTKAIREPQSMGIYTVGQFMDPKSSIQIGRNIAGTPGAIAGGAVAYTAAMGRWITAKVAGEPYVNPAEQIRKQIDQQYQEAHMRYQEAQYRVQLAEYNLQQHELMTPVPDRDESYYEMHKQLQQVRDEEVRKLHIERLALREAENMKANEHHYVGIGLKMHELRRQHHARGDMNGHEWR